MECIPWTVYLIWFKNFHRKSFFRFKNGTPEVQLSCVKHLKSYFVNHPELRDDLEGSFLFSMKSFIIRLLFWLDVMVQLSLSTDTNIRSQLMTQIRAITNSNLFDISDKMKQIVCERARDKIVWKNKWCVFFGICVLGFLFLVGSSKRSTGLSGTCL